jgi:peptide/nickel transport system substrate-binding protein
VTRRFRPRIYGALVGAVAVTMLGAACSSTTSTHGTGTGTGTGSTGSKTVSAGFQAVDPGGAPQYGGTLTMIGVSDVDHLDYDIGYYSTDYQALRLYLRQLYSWPAIPGNNLTPEPDLATGPPVISPDGKTWTITMRSGLMWNTSPPRPVTTADVARGIKRACNPSPVNFGGMADFVNAIQGLSAFCTGYPKAAATSAAVMKQYIETHNISGVTTSGDTITLKLTAPAPWLIGALTLPPFSAIPIESESGLPGSPQIYNHMYSDGPYTISSYSPGKVLDFVRNPQWQASTDPLRKAYVDAININETGTQTVIYQEIGTGTRALGMTWDSLVPPADDAHLISLIEGGSQLANLGNTYSSNPFITFNTISPNDNNALGKVAVRQALSYGIDRSQLVKQLGGPNTNIPLTHILPPGTDGAQDVPAGYDPYPYNPDKAKQMLSAAGYTSSHPLVLKLLYRSDSQGSVKVFLNLQQQLNNLGSVQAQGLPTNLADFYGKYLNPAVAPSASPAGKGVWDLATNGWGPDWFGASAVTWFNPLFSAPGGYPENGGSNFGYFQSSAVNGLIQQALAQTSESAADQFWAKADMQVMSEAAIYPITDPLTFAEHAPWVHNAVYMTQWQGFDPANVWVSH